MSEKGCAQPSPELVPDFWYFFLNLMFVLIRSQMYMHTHGMILGQTDTLGSWDYICHHVFYRPDHSIVSTGDSWNGSSTNIR